MGDDEPDQHVTLHDAAEQLGVHYMTAYRYVRTGRLPATQEGRRWWVRSADLASFRDRVVVERVDGADHVEREVATLLASDEAGAWAVVEGRLAGGATPAAIHAEVLAPALVEIGDRWARGEITVADEHAASAVATRVIARVGQLCTRPGVKRGGVLLSAVPGDHHGLPSAMLTNLLRARGFVVRDLGANPDLESLAVGAGRVPDLRVVALSATTPDNDASIRAAIDALRPLGVPVLLGGSAVADGPTAERLGADGWAPAEGAVALIEATADGP